MNSIFSKLHTSSLVGTGIWIGSAIEKQLPDIGVWNSQTRLNFIQAVGKAAEVLTDDQRTKLVGETGDEETTSSNAHDHKD